MALTIDSREVLATADLYRRADKDLKREMNRTVSREVNPWLRSAIRRNARTGPEQKIAGSARTRSGQRPAVVVGNRARFGGGATTTDLAAVYEFGGYQQYKNPGYDRRNPGGSGRHRVRDRRTQKQIPRRRTAGPVYSAVADAAPMLVGAWIGAILDTYRAA